MLIYTRPATLYDLRHWHDAMHISVFFQKKNIIHHTWYMSIIMVQIRVGRTKNISKFILYVLHLEKLLLNTSFVAMYSRLFFTNILYIFTKIGETPDVHRTFTSEGHSRVGTTVWQETVQHHRARGMNITLRGFCHRTESYLFLFLLDLWNTEQEMGMNYIHM